MTSPDNQIRELVKEIEAVLFSDHEEAKRLIEHLLDLSSIQEDVFGLYKANNMLGILCSDLGKVDEALDFYTVAMSYMVFEEVKDERPVLLNNIGNAIAICGNYFEAIENFTDALNFIDETGIHKDLIFTLYLNIAEAYLNIGEPKEALDIINESQVHFDEKFQGDRVTMLGLLSSAYLGLGDYKSAYAHILLCEEAAQSSNYLVLNVLINYYKAKYFELTGSFVDAEVFYDKALSSQFEGDSFYYFNQIALDFAAYLVNRKEYERAIPFIYKSIALAQQKHWNWVILDYFRILAECYTEIGDLNHAVESSKAYFEIEKINKVKRNAQNYNCFKVQEKILNIKLKNRTLNDAIVRMKAVNNILKQINASSDLMKLIEILYGSLKSLFKIDTFALGLYDDTRDVINYISKFENGISMGASQVGYDNEKSFSSYVRRTNKPVIIHDIDDFEAIQTLYPNVKIVKEDISNIGNHSMSIVIWPMQVEDKPIGLINCQALERQTFSEFDIELIEMLAAHLAIAVENHMQKRELSDAVDRLNKMTFIDSLTDVYNRQALNEYLPKLYDKAIIEKENIVFAMVDLDNFKMLNDQYGHQQGDQCLLAFAELLKSTMGHLGYIYRYGGDEFSLLFVGLEHDVVEAILETVISKSSDFYSVGDVINITASIGAVFVDDGNCANVSLSSFINYADNALYIAKNEGKKAFRKVLL